MGFPEEKIEGAIVFRPAGRIDGSELNDVESRIIELVGSNQNRILIDMSVVDFINSAGLRTLLIIGKRLQVANGGLTLFGLQENVARVFEIARFNNIFPIYSSEAEAANTLHRPYAVGS
ncbi:MAG TPA: STAS domain-containing protein [Blastocatellia bacterium]|nr:STAS domain-containing protein [Blastocatellia bacterium]